jgi:homoserine O-acetyltransferase
LEIVMKSIVHFALLVLSLLFGGGSIAAAANYPEPQQGDWIAHDFRFHTGEVLAKVNLHYRTIGAPTGQPVLVLHGTAGSGKSMLSKDFADQLFGPGQALDASRYYLIFPDALGTGQSAKPSDGLRANFPAYDYDDMVLAQYRLLTEGLGVKHLRLVIGYSMGGMQTWLWGEQHPDFMDALVPMASLPIAMSGRNWMLRRLLTQSIRNDPDWNAGNYVTQPRAMQNHLVYFGLASSGGTQALFKQAPNAAQGDELIAKRMAKPFTGDANDVLYQWESSVNYDPSAGLERVQAMVLAINSSDDERNPQELGILARELKRVKNGKEIWIPGGPDTRGHGTAIMAKFYQQQLLELLETAPQR